MKEANERNQTLKDQGFYHSAAWRKTRKLALQRDRYLCQHCLAKRVITVATEVHHKKELEEYPELALDLSNLVSLCWRCHEATKHKPKKRKDVPARVIDVHPPCPSDFF